MTASREIMLQTSQREELLDITQKVRKVIKELGLRQGLVHVYSPHTTAGILIQENADPDLRADLIDAFAKMFPQKGWRHREGNADAHLKATLCGASASVPMVNGQLALGTWQDIYFGEFDGPRQRRVIVTVVGEA